MIFDSAREELFEKACDMDGRDIILIEDLHEHLRLLLAKRLDGVERPCVDGYFAGDVAYALRFTFDEARLIASCRSLTLQLADRRLQQDEHVKISEIPVEILGLIDEALTECQWPDDGYYAADVLRALSSS